MNRNIKCIGLNVRVSETHIRERNGKRQKDRCVV